MQNPRFSGFYIVAGLENSTLQGHSRCRREPFQQNIRHTGMPCKCLRARQLRRMLKNTDLRTGCSEKCATEWPTGPFLQNPRFPGFYICICRIACLCPRPYLSHGLLPAKHPPHRHALQVPESPATKADAVNFSTPVSISHPARGSVGSSRGRCLAGKYLKVFCWKISIGWKISKGVLQVNIQVQRHRPHIPARPGSCR